MSKPTPPGSQGPTGPCFPAEGHSGCERQRHEERLGGRCSRGRRRGPKPNPYLNRNDDPRLKRTGFGFGLGSSKSLKNAWCSTQIFQKDLQKSRLAMRNSKVSWYELWKEKTPLWFFVFFSISHRHWAEKWENGQKTNESHKTSAVCFIRAWP